MPRSLLLALLLAVPAAADDKPKPRPKLLGTVKVAGQVTELCWTPDAKHLVLVTPEKGVVVGRDQLGEDTPAKPVGEFTVPAGGNGKYAVTADGTEVYAVVSPAGRFNAETRVCYWTLKDLLDGKKKPKPDRVVSLAAETPAAFAFTADGKSLHAVASEPRGGGAVQQNGLPQQIGKVLKLDAKTGDVAEELATLDEPDGHLVGAALHPDSGRTFAHFQTADEHVVRAFEAGTKKAKWERRFERPSPNPSGAVPRVSPDGKVVVAICSRQFEGPQPGYIPQPGQPLPQTTLTASTPHLLNAATGEVIADLGGDDVPNSDVAAFSADGRLIFGWLGRNSGMQQVVWDAATGKPLKTWNRGVGSVPAAFSPKGHELATAEYGNATVTVPANPNPPGGFDRVVRGYEPFTQLFQQQLQVVEVPQVQAATTVGVWDLAPLVK